MHTPLQTTRAEYEAVGDIQPDRLRVYAAMVRALNRSVERIMGKLNEMGLTENTLVVFTSDNGSAGYIGVPEVNAPYRGWNLTFFEGSIRTPLFMHCPRRIAPGETVTLPVAHIDLMPTFAVAAGVALPNDRVIDCVDLLLAATGEGRVERPGEALYWQSVYYQAVRRGDWKLQVDSQQGKKWLFDLAEDPTEQSNLVDQESDITKELTELLAAHQADRTPPRYPYTTEAPTPIDKTRADPVTVEDEFIYWLNRDEKSQCRSGLSTANLITPPEPQEGSLKARATPPADRCTL